jgi:hypothetical protein
MNEALPAFRLVDFNWTRDLQSIWSDTGIQVDELHKPLADELINDFLVQTRKPTDNPIGRIILGQPGAGKTHLLGTLRRRVCDAGGWFVLLDIIGITDFWATAAFGVLKSLHQQMPGGRAQYEAVLSTVVRQIPLDPQTRTAIARWEGKPEKSRLDTVELFVKLLRRVDPFNIIQHQDVVRALLLLGSDDWDANNLAYCWLQGLDVDENERRKLGFLKPPPAYPELVRGMLWVMSLAGPTLIAVDQIDAIVSASNLLAGINDEPNDDTERKARSIIDLLAGGLMDLHELKRRALTVVTCLAVTWRIIKDRSVKSAPHRFMELPALEEIKDPEIVERLIRGRLEPAYAAQEFQPPYPAWPFRHEAIGSAIGLTPRQILIRCHEHRQRCVSAGEVMECTSLGEVPLRPRQETCDNDLDQEYQTQIAGASVAGLLDQDNEDSQFSKLLLDMLDLYVRHLDLSEDIEGLVQADPDQKRPSLHGRLSFTFHNEGDREQHYCFRILGHTNARAFLARLKAAMTASGVDRALKFRHLFILRNCEPPRGEKTTLLVDQFKNAGGEFIAPAEGDLRAFVALQAMSKRDIVGFDAWLRHRKPLFETSLFKAAGLCPPPFPPATLPPQPRKDPNTRNTESGATIRPHSAEDDAAVKTAGAAGEQIGPATPERPATPRAVPIGRRYERGALGDAITLPADLLPRHIAILAGSGSGKTVLLRRIVEEAALIDIPSIVLDINNDLARLGDAWPSRPVGFSDEDAAKAAAYRKRADVVIWTPGRNSGRPISLKLIPDFSAIGDDPDEREQAVEMARATLTPFVGGTGASAKLKQGVLSGALRYFALDRRSALGDLIGLLADLPEGVSEISKTAKLGAEIADQLRAAIDTNPLLKSSGANLDPTTLFRGSSGKTRISVINLSGLGSDDARQSFVNQLQMTLFMLIPSEIAHHSDFKSPMIPK